MARFRLPWKPVVSVIGAFLIFYGLLLVTPASVVRADDPTATPTFTPTATATATGTAAVTPTPTATATPIATATFTPVPASATKPVASLSATTISFGSVPQGTTSANQTVTLTNTGGANLNFLTAPELKGGEVNDFSIGPNSCGTAAPLAPGTSCTVVVRFNPARDATGNRSTTLLFRDDSLTGSPQFVLLSGIATANTPTVISSIGISFAPTTINFGSQPIGIVSGSQFIVVTNTGANYLTIASIAKSGGDSQDFSNPSTNCVTTLSPGAQCQISITFNPTTSGNRAATLIVTDNAPVDGSTQVIVVSGIGTGTAPLPPPLPTPTFVSQPLPPTPTVVPPAAPTATPTSPATQPTPTTTAPTPPALSPTPAITATIFLPGLPNTGAGSQQGNVQARGQAQVNLLLWLIALVPLLPLALVARRRWLRKG